MSNDYTDDAANNTFERHIEVIQSMKSAMRNAPVTGFSTLCGGGLAELQKTTVTLMNRESRDWGFANSPFRVKRQKIGVDMWKITVENPKTREIVLEAQGHGDKVFAYEDSLARMAEALADKDLEITTPSKR